MTISFPLLLAMTAGVAFLIGLSKGGLGGTIGALATPLMALVLPADEVIGLLLPMLIVADVFAVATHWRRWEWKLVRLLIPGAVAGVTIGTFFITNAPTGALRTALALIVLLFSVYKLVEGWLSRRLARQAQNPAAGPANPGPAANLWKTPGAGLTMGTVAGFSSALAHTGGPPVSIYLLQQEIAPRTFVATSALFFALLNWIKVPYYLYAGLFDFERLRSLALALPFLPLGVWVGRAFVTRINRPLFERIIVVLLALAAVLLLIE